MKDLFFAIWFFLPAGIANVTPIFAAKIPFLKHWNYPLDLFKNIYNKRIFGDHKTVRGFITGILLGTLTSYLLFQTSNNIPYAINHLPDWYFQTNPIILGFLLSTGALLGDAVKSFFKRQVNIHPGSTWIPLDQIDYILGGLLLGSFIHILTFAEYRVIIVLWFGIHLMSTTLGYFLHLKEKPL